MLCRKRFALLLSLIITINLLTSCMFLAEDTDLSIHVIDVGQGDSILVKTPNGKTMLIDGGEPTAGRSVVSYLRKNKVKKIDVLIATHPHADHIGGLIDVIDRFQIDNFYIPYKIHTSKTYESLLDAANNKGLKATPATNDIMINLDEDIVLYFLGPLKDYGDDLNNWSVVIKLDYKVQSFLFTGDLESLGEVDLLTAYNADFLHAQFLKVAHHGSNTSTSQRFLEAVQPKIAVISSGKDNSYGHPHQEVIDRLRDLNMAIYRTDQQGTIVIKSDGNRIWSNEKPYYH